MVAESQVEAVNAPVVFDAQLLLAAVRDAMRASMSLPFDALRVEYAEAVRLGVARRSMLDSRDFESVVDALERCTLGPFARGV